MIGKLREAGVEVSAEQERRARCVAARQLTGGRHPHPALSRLSHRHAGPVHGPDVRGPGALGASRETIFENRFMHVAS